MSTGPGRFGLVFSPIAFAGWQAIHSLGAWLRHRPDPALLYGVAGVMALAALLVRVRAIPPSRHPFAYAVGAAVAADLVGAAQRPSSGGALSLAGVAIAIAAKIAWDYLDWFLVRAAADPGAPARTESGA